MIKEGVGKAGFTVKVEEAFSICPNTSRGEPSMPSTVPLLNPPSWNPTLPIPPYLRNW